MVWPAVIGAAASLGGSALSFLGSQSNAAASNQFAWAQMQQQNQLAQQNIQLQKDFAQQGIRWKVADAEAAGLHPLFALGGNTTSFSPVSVGSVEAPRGPDYSHFANMGQDVSRAIRATMTKEERKADMFQHLDIERKQLENELLRSQISSSNFRTYNNGQIGPPIPAMGPGTSTHSTGTGVYEPKAPEVANPQPSNAGTEAGPARPAIQWRQNSDGSFFAQPGEGMNIDEFTSPGYTNFMMKNRVAPFLGNGVPPPQSMLPPGHVSWRFDGMSWWPVKREDFFKHLPERPNPRQYAHPYHRKGREQ